MIEQLVMLYDEQYQEAVVKAVFICIYYESRENLILKSIELPNINIEDILNVIDYEIESGKLPDVKSIISVKSRTPIKVTTIKGVRPQCYPFIVADLETILVNNVHVPYTAGYLVVKSGDDLTSEPLIHTFFSEDHIPFYHTFEERSERCSSGSRKKL